MYSVYDVFATPSGLINSAVQVSPYMEFGHVRHFLEDHPDADRVLLLKEIASGVFSYWVTCTTTH